MPDTNAGPRIAGHRLSGRIGGGHFGDVWRAEFEGRPVAVKVFNSRGRIPALRREAFAQETLGRVEGPDAAFFPRVEAVDFDHDPPFVRMELVDARPLEDAIRDGGLSLDHRLAIGRRVLEALDAVHRRGFVHGDLSPGNVLVASDGAVKLIDVGCGALFDEGAREIEMSGPAEDQSMGVAAPLYAAPERFRSEFLRGCGRSADVFSFGKLFYALVSGQAPFVIKPVSRAVPALAAGWDDFIFACLEEDPTRRPQDAAAALVAFDRLHRPAARPGEFRAACPECGAPTAVPGGWEGERFDCAGCGLTLEVLFYDEEARHASTAVVAEAAPPGRPDVEFLEDPSPAEPDARVRKFCPTCGRGIWAEAHKCRHCGIWVDEAARTLVAARERERIHEREVAAMRERRFVAPAMATFLAYFLFWLPGAILNWEYLREANRVEQLTGAAPAGHGALKAMMVLLTWIPLGLIAGLVGSAVFFGILSS
jgi:predicted Ser/Thr protein kinase